MLQRPLPKVRDKLPVAEFHERFKRPLKMDLVAGEKGLGKPIRENVINRPALAVTGYMKNFGYKRIQLFGAGEMAYLREMEKPGQYEVLSRIAEKNIPCMVVSRNLLPVKAMFRAAQERDVPLFRTPLTSRIFINTATLFLEDVFAPRLTEHGTLLDVDGTGVLLRGESGVGKSECALALIERGHSLVADDVVHIRLVNECELSASSSELNRGYMECRGLGIINIAELFGVRAVRLEKRVSMVVTFEFWRADMEEERTGMEEEFYDILGVPVPHIRLPVRPGRDLARLVEVAAMVHGLKRMGHDPAREFNERLIAFMTQKDGEK